MDEKQQAIRQTIVPTLNRRNQPNALNTSERKALEVLKKDRNIIILLADKSRSTVGMNKLDYNGKAQKLLADINTYQQKESDPTTQLENKSNVAGKAQQ
eukprot:g23981.t1